MFNPPVYSPVYSPTRLTQPPFHPGLKRDYSFSPDLESNMARVPLVGRLYFREYIALVFSFLLLTIEFLARIITLALPSPVINFLYARSRALFKLLPSTQRSHIDRKSSQSIVKKIRDADGFVEMCAIWGYDAEEHIVQTKDGYLLGLHRIPRAKDEVKPKRGEKGRPKKGVVYLHHGLMMNSEVWVCNLEPEKCLPFVLAEQGYDVWLGNNRGNKYSKKCIYTNSQDASFWNFSIDEFAMHDIPDSISYILLSTKVKSISYVGFSQGTAQAFAALSIHPDLNEIIDVFVALAPAMSPAGLYNSIVDALVKASPDVIFLFFGRRSLLPSTMFWQSILYPPIFVTAIDKSLQFLFNWTGKNITLQQKLASYAHLYSFTSVKALVHWFQIIRNKKFQMYDDDVQSPVGWGYGRSYYKPAKFPTKNISAPVVLVYGGSDSLVDIEVMMKELPDHTIAKEIKHYEHLDFLWGEETDTLVIPHVLEALNLYGGGGTPAEKEILPGSGIPVIVGGEPPGYSEDEKNEKSKEGEGNTDKAPTDSAAEGSPNDRAKPVAVPAASDNAASTAPSSITSSITSGPLWPAWLGGRGRLRRSPSVASLTSVSSTGSDSGKNRGVVFGPNGVQIGAGKASSAVSTTVLGEGEDIVEKKRKRRRRAENHSQTTQQNSVRDKRYPFGTPDKIAKSSYETEKIAQFSYETDEIAQFSDETDEFDQVALESNYNIPQSFRKDPSNIGSRSRNFIPRVNLNELPKDHPYYIYFHYKEFQALRNLMGWPGSRAVDNHSDSQLKDRYASCMFQKDPIKFWLLRDVAEKFPTKVREKENTYMRIYGGAFTDAEWQDLEHRKDLEESSESDAKELGRQGDLLTPRQFPSIVISRKFGNRDLVHHAENLEEADLDKDISHPPKKKAANNWAQRFVRLFPGSSRESGYLNAPTWRQSVHTVIRAGESRDKRLPNDVNSTFIRTIERCSDPDFRVLLIQKLRSYRPTLKQESSGIDSKVDIGGKRFDMNEDAWGSLNDIQVSEFEKHLRNNWDRLLQIFKAEALRRGVSFSIDKPAPLSHDISSGMEGLGDPAYPYDIIESSSFELPENIQPVSPRPESNQSNISFSYAPIFGTAISDISDEEVTNISGIEEETTVKIRAIYILIQLMIIREMGRKYRNHSSEQGSYSSSLDGISVQNESVDSASEDSINTGNTGKKHSHDVVDNTPQPGNDSIGNQRQGSSDRQSWSKKRKRGEDGDGDEEDDDKNRKRDCPDRRTRWNKMMSLGLLLACPFAKGHPTSHLGCLTIGRKDLAGIKEHLRRKHFQNTLPDNIRASRSWNDVFYCCFPEWQPMEPPCSILRLETTFEFITRFATPGTNSNMAPDIPLSHLPNFTSEEHSDPSSEVATSFNMTEDFGRRTGGRTANNIPLPDSLNGFFTAIAEPHMSWPPQAALEHQFNETPGYIQNNYGYDLTRPSREVSALLSGAGLGTNPFFQSINSHHSQYLGGADMCSKYPSDSGTGIQFSHNSNSSAASITNTLPSMVYSSSQPTELTTDTPDPICIANEPKSKYTLIVSRSPEVDTSETKGVKKYQFENFDEFRGGFDIWLERSFHEPPFSWETMALRNEIRKSLLTNVDKVAEELDFWYLSNETTRAAFSLVMKDQGKRGAE
ncbi:hypothetical protein H072_6519 [Dactylellina haptotyla CBS 200.50]|uniref:Partial AB-hydrolase lipase domain-containing protein n=1 Tax=Dactylellina haptotyla (strain CBS 200.50) TaxID=1284197 RepID=S8A9I5_DACHA|nr:hypothetical protein H072_6519 [Dactylellina haptotyla CBS 200.50]